MSKRKVAKRRDASPARAYADGRVAYYTGGKAGVGERKMFRAGSAESAAVWADAYNSRAEESSDPDDWPQTDRTLDDMFQDFIDHLRACGEPEGTIRQYKSNWNTWVPAKVGKTQCGLAQLWHFTVVFNNLSQQHASLGTVRAVARTLGAAIAHGVENGFFGTALPFATPDARKQVVKKAADKARKRAEAERHYDNASCPSPEDVDLFAAAVEEQYPGYGARLVWMGFATGLRINEVLALRWDSIDLVTGLVCVDWQLDRYRPWPALALPKGGKRRDSRIWRGYMDVAESLVLDALERSGEDNGWLFPRHRSVTGWADQAGKLVGAAIKATSWSWTYHWLRHGFASWTLLAKDKGGFGIEIEVVQDWLGHSRPSITRDMYVEKRTGGDDEAWAETGRPSGRAA